MTQQDSLNLVTQDDVVLARQLTRTWAIKAHLSLVDQTKIVTAASELARNTIIYGGGGVMVVEAVFSGDRPGIKLTFEDQGPGIPDIEQALKDGFTTGRGLGLGLGGARRLSSEFDIESEPGRGTRITLIRWKT